MRKTFERAGFVKEAHLRNAWFSPKENSYYDAVTYGITREDFMAGTTTPVVWEDGSKRGNEESRRIPDFPDSFESERLLIRAPKIEDALDVWNAIRHSLPALREWMPWAQAEPNCMKYRRKFTPSDCGFYYTKRFTISFVFKRNG